MPTARPRSDTAPGRLKSVPAIGRGGAAHRYHRRVTSLELSIVDTEHWPLALVVGTQAADAEFTDRLICDLEALLSHGERFCVLCDMTATTQLRLPEIKKLGAFAKRNGTRLDSQIAALAIASPSAFVRGALRVLFSIKTPGHPYQVCRSLTEANEWMAPFSSELTGAHAEAI